MPRWTNAPAGEPTRLTRWSRSSNPHLSKRRGCPRNELETRERRERLENKVRLLSPAHRVVLVLRDIEGFSYEEIAVVTETPLGSVKGRLHRARGELIDILRHNTYDWELPA